MHVPYRCPDCRSLVKNETVSGISGNTQGVSSAINPPRSPSRKILTSPLPAVPVSPQGLTGCFRSKLLIRIRKLY